MYSVAARLEALCTQDDSRKLEGALHGITDLMQSRDVTSRNIFYIHSHQVIRSTSNKNVASLLASSIM